MDEVRYLCRTNPDPTWGRTTKEMHMARNTAPAGKTTKSTTKKAPAKATASKAPAKAKTTAEGRKPRGHLAADVLTICKAYSNGKLKVEGDKPLTPHRVAKLVAERTGGDAPSTGAVAAVFDRWAEYGFALFSDAPKAFKKLTAKGEKDGLDGIILGRREARKAATVKERAARAKAAE